MQVTLADASVSTNDASRSALEFVHRLLVRPAGDHPPLTELLAQLAEAFRTREVGLACLPEGRLVLRHPPENSDADFSWPWQNDPCLLESARQRSRAVALSYHEDLLLVTSIVCPGGGAWVLWLQDQQQRAFTEAEAAALHLVGQALSPWLSSEGSARWADQLDLALRQDRLETSAAVTRRLAHDFGNLLTGILGFTELAMSQQVPANTPLYSYLQEVYRAAQAGAQFTHQLRLFSRRQSASSHPSDLGSLLAEQEARLFAAQPHGLTVRLNVPEGLPAVALEADYLHQVLSALLDNAREALMGSGVISVSARVVELTASDCRDLYGAVGPGPHVEITLADTGIGLSPEVQRKLFVEPFFTSKPRRRGFGLAVAYGILHAHKGGLRLHPGEERGVVARVVLPIAPMPAPGLTSKTQEVICPSERVRGERILVVDDEPEVLQLVSTSLERAGFRVEAVASGEAALQAYFAQPGDPFRMVLTDVVMPGMGGVELVRRLLRRDPAVRVLFMSGHVSSDFTQQDFANHAFELVAKPFRPEQLVRAIRAGLDRVVRPRAKGEGEPTARSGVATNECSH